MPVVRFYLHGMVWGASCPTQEKSEMAYLQPRGVKKNVRYLKIASVCAAVAYWLGSRTGVPKGLGSSSLHCHLRLRSSLGKGIWSHTHSLLPEKPQAYILASSPSIKVAEYLKKSMKF